MLAYRDLTRRRGSERPAERLLGYLPLGSGCTLKHSRVSCLLITLSSSSASASLSRSIISALAIATLLSLPVLRRRSTHSHYERER